MAPDGIEWSTEEATLENKKFWVGKLAWIHLKGKQKLIFIFITECCSILPLQLIYSVAKKSHY